ncbi:hypothetical protein BDA99DRAFT_504601 [Phascolomyces articulosus]|uniref:Uncharacterized protein n=1 Tax=Phascolomyces articulosus TaxID=60185 RepID=A0AAD5K3H6_9FUNG|nr:hypothetical protein BDA99DRAFT_504601 [Phascolomyces articulosus]
MVLWKREQQQALESQTKPKPTSLAQLSQRSHPRTSALQSLANRNTPTKSDSEDGKTKPSLLGLAKKNNEAKKSTGVGPSSSLQSLAQKATGQRGQTALQSLASRQTSRPLSSSSTTTEPPKTSLTALAKLAKKEDASAQRTRLSHLATRTTTTTTTAPSPSTNNKLSGLAGLAKKQNVASTTPEYKKKDEKPISSNVKEQPKIQEEIPRQQQSLPSEQSQQPKILIPLSTNPLCAPPSAAATFLFKNPGKGGRGHTDTTANSLLASIPDSVGKAFYEAIKTSADNIHVFTFNVPSPDDIGLEAQSHRSGGRK